MSSAPLQRPGRSNLPDLPQDTNLLDFTQSICRLFTRRMRQQHIALGLEVEPTVQFRISRASTGQTLVQMIEDALRAMPHGGQLDIVAVVGPNGLEIEVADSSSESDFELRIHGRAHGTAGHASSTTVPSGMRLETRRCPQGGIARTLCVPWAQTRAAA